MAFESTSRDFFSFENDEPTPRIPPPEDAARSSMMSTELLQYHRELHARPRPVVPDDSVQEICWNARYRVLRRLGSGAQGVVYLAEREGVDGYRTNVAVKLYFRDPEGDLLEYLAEMRRVARQGQRVSHIQHDNLIAIRDFVAVDQTRVMVMEWVDGLDLDQLLDRERFLSLRRHIAPTDWDRLNDVVVSPGPNHCRLKPGIAVDILRGCLAGLSALHHHGIVHSDLKPANIMIKRTGTKKVVDIDSSCVPSEEPVPGIRGTPYYMAPEVLRDHQIGLQADIASLGYILVEMLTGRLLFQNAESIDDLIAAKLELPARLKDLLPPEVWRSALLSGLCKKMVAVAPEERFADADAVDLDRRLGAASFHRQLIQGNLSTEYDRELAWWLERCHDAEVAV